MSTVKTKTTQPETPNEVQGRDCFMSPNYSLDIILPFMPNPNEINIWECAAGSGKMVKYLTRKGYFVYGTDINNQWNYLNFLDCTSIPKQLDNKPVMVITNPPFSLKAKFYKKCIELGVIFGLLMPADYSGWNIDAIRYDFSEKIIPSRRINYLTPNILNRINDGEETNYFNIDHVPHQIINKYSSSDFHSYWLTNGLSLGKSETFVELTKEMKENI